MFIYSNKYRTLLLNVNCSCASEDRVCDKLQGDSRGDLHHLLMLGLQR